MIEDDDADERTTPHGLFFLADAYWQGARTLGRDASMGDHSQSPVYFLYYHAIELYLKAFLRQRGLGVKLLASKKYGHKTCCLSEKAGELGLTFVDEDKDVFSLMATTDAVIRSRYIRTGFFHWPTLEALDRTCKSLSGAIGVELKKAKLPVR